MKKILRNSIILITGTILLFSCSDNNDQREQTRKGLGEPDEIISQNMYSYKTEYWIYTRSDINTVYQFNKSASGCGGDAKWYLATRYYADYHFGYDLWDPPPTITHAPITIAPPDKGITIFANVKLFKKALVDKQVERVDLNYRAVGDSLFDYVVMAREDSLTGLYSGGIPAMAVTSSGIEYFIKATSDNTHWSTLPKDGSSFIIAVSDTVSHAQKASKTRTNFEETPRITLPLPAFSSESGSPLSQ